MSLQEESYLLKFSNFIGRTNKWVGNVICYLVIAMMLTGVYEVAMRYFFNRPTIWVWETNGLLLCVFVALGGGYTLLVRGHVRVDVVYVHWSTRVKAIMDLASSSLLFLFLGVLLWQGAKLGLLSLERLEHTQTIFRPPIYPFKIILVVGIFLFLLQGLADFVHSVHIACTGTREDNGT